MSVVPGQHFVSYPGGNATFTCINLGIDNVQWLVNETEFESLTLENVWQDFVSLPLGGVVGTLAFVDIPLEYNMTRIQCRVNRTDETSDQSPILILQG